MSEPEGLSYRAAGVDLDAADRAWGFGTDEDYLRYVVRSDDSRVPRVLHHHLEQAQRYGTAIGDLDHWRSVAAVLVRFGVRDHMDWYTDGPAPSREWIMEDVEQYLTAHDEPPVEQWPIAYGPSDAIPRLRRRPTRTPWWRRVFGR